MALLTASPQDALKNPFIGDAAFTKQNLKESRFPVPVVLGVGTTAPVGAVGSAIANSLPSQSGQAYTDPYAKWGGQAAYNNLRAGFDTQKQNIYGTADEATSNAGIGLKNSILDFVDSLRNSQRNIDTQAINNELARKQGQNEVQGMVSRGIKSGGVVLANKNAGDSSAAGAIANAYGDIGRREMSNVGNQYEMGNREVGLMQEDLEMQRGSGMRRIGASKEQVVGNIVSEARNSLAALDAQMLDASLPDRIAIEQEKEAIRQRVLGQLNQYDQMLASEAGNVRAMGQEQRRSEAARLAGLGQAPAESFQFDAEAPTQFQGTGPFASELPIFTFNRNKRQV